MFLKNFKFHRKTLGLESLFKKETGLNPGTLLKNRLRHGCFPMIFAKLLQQLFYRTPATASVYEEVDHKSEDCF